MNDWEIIVLRLVRKFKVPVNKAISFDGIIFIQLLNKIRFNGELVRRKVVSNWSDRTGSVMIYHD